MTDDPEDTTPHRAANTRAMQRWRLAACAMGAALLLIAGWWAGSAPEPQTAVAAAVTQPQHEAMEDELAAAKAEVASCRQLAKVALGLTTVVVDAGIKHASGHDKAGKGKPIGDPRKLQPGTVWGDEWGPTLRIIHHGGQPAKDAAEAWRQECVK